jgi:hypothetical protein
MRKMTMKKLLLDVPSIFLLSATLLFGSFIPMISAVGEDRFEEQEDELSCTICYSPYTHESIIVQQDCYHTDNLHFCLPCSHSLVTTNNAQSCAVCRNPHYKIHDPRVRKDSYTYVHHRQTPLNHQEQEQLRRYLGSVGAHRISLKAAPDTIVRQCSSCNHAVEKDKVILELDCGHNLCLRDAAKLANNNKIVCPICKALPSTITDPLEMDAQNKIVLKYLQRAPTKEEATLLQKVRSSASLFQEHIAPERRVPITSKTAPTKSTREKKAPNQIAAEREKDPMKNRQDLRVVKGTYPLTAQSDEDTKLNKEHLPEHLDPQDWQVIIVPSQSGKENELARMRRVQEDSKTQKIVNRNSSSEKEEDLDEAQCPEILRGYSGDIIAGLCIGLLIGQEYDKPNRFTPKAVWLGYGGAALAAYSLIQKNNPGRPFKQKYAYRWAAGIAAGIAVHALLGSNK